MTSVQYSVVISQNDVYLCSRDTRARFPERTAYLKLWILKS